MKSLLLALMTAASLIPSAAFPAHDGSESSSGGGPGIAAEFVRLSTFSLRALATVTPIRIQNRTVDLKAMESVLPKLDIRPTKDTLKIDGKIVDAINHPDDDSIDINIAGWEKRSDDTKLQLAIHEIWGLAFHDHQDDSFLYSTEMVKQVRTTGLRYEQEISCVGDDASMEIFFPTDAVFSSDHLVEYLAKNGKVTGFYALDLNGAGKGKSIEPVFLSISPDKKAIVMQQFTRPGLLKANIPIAGGTLDFDHRFGTNAKCSALSNK